ncbi:MAG: endonuclease III [Bdellovibrionaceae bacterium]|nr:endonuclease III [Pseudobdellovibrionaceae bacterium]
MKNLPLDYNKAFRALKKNYPDAQCALIHKGAFQLLIATILSAQCTDKRVNQVTPLLFKKYPTAELMAKARLASVEKLIHSTGFYHNKAKNIISCSQSLVKHFNKQVPDNLKDLIQLAGVGRKTANVVLGVIFNKPEGIVVDTHVKRLAFRFGWTKSNNPVIIEKQLQKVISVKYWIILSHWLILHGRALCKARSPQCKLCFFKKECPYYSELRQS